MLNAFRNVTHIPNGHSISKANCRDYALRRKEVSTVSSKNTQNDEPHEKKCAFLNAECTS